MPVPVTVLRAAAAALLIATIATPATGTDEWTSFGEDSGAVCADGSPVHYLERAADPTRVVLYFEGGGACFSAATCAFDGPAKSYISSSDATPDLLAGRPGMFDFDRPDNPLADFSFVYVPYCTGDVHLGNKEATYSDDLVVEHRGYPNGLIALDHLAEAYPDAEEVVVAGSSGGSVPTPLFAGLAADRLPDARIVSLADSSGAFPDDPMLNVVIGSLWGTMAAMPDWPQLAGITLAEWGIPKLYRYAAEHAPEVVFAKFDYDHDSTQAHYRDLVGVGSDDMPAVIDAIDSDISADVEAAGATVTSYIAPGTDHTILGADAFYTLTVDGMPFVEWVSALADGEIPGDVH
jgi:Pectinacetylesterase